jgi:hypothetical protein
MKTVAQCKSCPWRVDCVPEEDIPNYHRALHDKLDNTIRSGVGTLFGPLRIMACHHSEPGKEFPCAGWLFHQLGEGNNIAARLAVLLKRLPVPKVDGPQHAHFEDTKSGGGQ